jgi:hypothetical protein
MFPGPARPWVETLAAPSSSLSFRSVTWITADAAAWR